MKVRLITFLVSAVSWCLPALSSPSDTVGWTARLTGGGATGDFAPYLIGSGSAGRYAMNSFIGAEGIIEKDFNLSRRFSWAASVDVAVARQGSANYLKAEGNSLTDAREWRPGTAWIQQFCAGVKWRGVFAKVAMEDHRSPIVDNCLSSGDLTLSDNARGVPGVWLGFVDYQNIPFTKGWVQINGEITYGKYFDNGSLKGRYNYFDGHITLGQLFTYKRAHFRTRTDRPLSVTVGVQAAGAFGGTTYFYSRGKEVLTQKNPGGIKTAWKMFIPSLGGNSDGFVEGNHLGTWDAKARYRLSCGVDLEGYFQWLWEDGSGMARRNMTDGLWGASLTMPGDYPALKKAVVEYIDFRDQSGAIHWSPADSPGTDITTEATGGDNYYNNSTFNAWANYGLGQGSSFPVAPLYNADGSLQFRRNRTRGLHLAATGYVVPQLTWTAKFSHGVAWGDGRRPDPRAFKNTSALVAAGWDARSLVDGLTLNGSVAFDAGKLRGNNFGALISVTYTGNFTFNKSRTTTDE